MIDMSSRKGWVMRENRQLTKAMSAKNGELYTVCCCT